VRRLSSLAWRSLGARKLRSFLTVVGIGLGVAVLFASLAAGAGMDAAVDKAAADEMGHADLRVQALQETGLSKETISAVESVPGVSIAAPALERKTYLSVSSNQTPSAQLPPPVTVLGIDPEREVMLHDLPLASGRHLSVGDDKRALVTESFAKAERVSVGDSVSLNGAAASGPQSYEVVGIVAGRGPLPEAEGRLVFLSLGSAQALFDTTAVTRIDVGAAPGISVEVLTGQLDVGIQTQPFLLSGVADLADSLRSQMTDFRSALILVSAVVLFAGAFLIFNTLSMTVGERGREVGLLRAAGTTRSQVMGFVLRQAFVLGVAGSVLGVVAGIGLAALTLAWVRSTGPIDLAAPELSPGSIAMAFLIGLAVTLAASLEPAWRAGRIPPAEALRRGPSGAVAGAARLRWLVLVFAVLAIAALAVLPGSGTRGATAIESLATGSGSGIWGPVAVYGLLVLAVLIMPRLLTPLLRVAGIPFRLFRNEERLARSSLSRDRSRTALTAGSLVVGLAMVVALGTAAQNVRRIGTSWLEETIPGSELLTSITPMSATDPVRELLAGVPGVKSISPIGVFDVPLVYSTEADGRSHDSLVLQVGAAIVGSDYLADGRLQFVAGDRAEALRQLDRGGAVIVPASLANSIGMHVGDTVEFATGPTVFSLRVAGIVSHSIPAQGQEAVLVGWTDALGQFGVTGADFYAARFEAGRETEARAALNAEAARYALQPNELDRVTGTVGDALDRVFRLLDALALVAVLIAGLGMVNTFSMSVLERGHEIGVLRATGMSSRQVWRMVVIEAGILGVSGAILGAILGVGVGTLLVYLSSGGFGLVLDPPWAAIAFAAVFGVLVSTTAAIYPAGVASRQSIVRALQHE
jgi:putative ABC transport system permease protein